MRKFAIGLTLMIAIATGNPTAVRAQDVNAHLEGAVIDGQVRRTDTSEPIAGAQVTAIPMRFFAPDGRLRDEPFDPSLIFTATTGADGRCVLRGVPEGILRISAEHDAFRVPDRGGISTPTISSTGANPPIFCCSSRGAGFTGEWLSVTAKS
jgi:hypothetical protein